jgi:hypothetical protein
VAGQDNQFGAKPALLLAIVAFPINPKRFMVRSGFAVGKCGLSMNIKGLAVAKRLWRVV